MGALKAGTPIRVEHLPGRWSVWSEAADCPGAYFLVPLDVEAQAVGVKYAVVRVIQPRDRAFPEITILRTDPPRPDLVPIKEKKKR